MKKVTIAELKARLIEHPREVRSGCSLTVLDRNTPIARLVPYPSDTDVLVIRKPLDPRRSVRDVPLPRPLDLDTDVRELLLEERRGER